jgi:hypothetical protein
MVILGIGVDATQGAEGLVRVCGLSIFLTLASNRLHWSRVYGARPALEVNEQDPRRPVYLIRSFVIDETAIGQRPLVPLSVPLTIEEAVTDQL